MKPKIINLTPHPINVVDKHGKVLVTFPPSGLVARCDVDLELDKVLDIDGVEIPIYKTTFGEVSNLPREEPDTFYIVSAAVAKAEIERRDLLIPNDLLRDKSGTIIGCHSFAIPNDVNPNSKEVNMDKTDNYSLLDLVIRFIMALVLCLVVTALQPMSFLTIGDLRLIQFAILLFAIGGTDKEYRWLFNLLILVLLGFVVYSIL